ncbi:MAG: Ig-like domain-containing protein [Bacteroidales bacterium]|nr:Ig-like domain-containing protein [Bacteroidales bacterium]
MKKSFIYIAALTLIVACNKVESPVQSQGSDIITAQIEQETATKTYMDANNNIRWSEGDQIAGFMKSSLGLKYQILPSSVGKTWASFENVSGSNGNINAGTEWDHNVVYYPYSDAVEAEKTGSNYTLNIVLPSEQTYAAESFGNGSMAMVAVSEDNNITFRNVLGGMKLQFKGTQKVTSITLQGRNNEKLSGAATVTAYTDETKPAITMSSDASTSVTLNCGSGVQLSESTVTEFILALPPVLFGQGFTVTVTDTDSKTYNVETDKANTVLRSSLLTMPAFKLGSNPSEEQPDDDELIIPVSYVNLNSTSLKLYEGDIAQLTATVGPKDATDKTVVWSSDNPAVVSVDQTGFVTAITAGTTKVTAASGGKSATCTVTVSTLAVAIANYVDEYDVNHGKGIVVGQTVWAPVNCGYHKEDFKYGKLYQWGRKYGQGYSGSLYDVNGNKAGEVSDATVPTFAEGGISEIGGNHKSNANVFYTGSYDWVDPRNNELWNSGSESNPVKTDYDPCPDGWRVPTYAELSELSKNHSSWTTDENGQVGYWFSGASTYTETVPQVFFPAAGRRYCSGGNALNRGSYGYYWSSRPSSEYAYRLNFRNGYADMFDNGRAYGYSVRCVQE